MTHQPTGEEMVRYLLQFAKDVKARKADRKLSIATIHVMFTALFDQLGIRFVTWKLNKAELRALQNATQTVVNDGLVTREPERTPQWVSS